MNSILQTKIWADFKTRHGWRTQEVHGLSVLTRQLPFGQTFAYVPEIPYDVTWLPTFIEELNKAAKKDGWFAVRVEFLAKFEQAHADNLQKLGLVKAFEDVQPEWRQWIPLEKDTAEIFQAMRPKGRYNVRLAERHGVKVTAETDPGIFLDLFRETAKRDGFSIRDDSYYIDLIKTLIESQHGELLVARLNNQPLAAAIISYYGPLASYLYGASSAEHREAMAPYALHWTAIQRAKATEANFYDLLAISPFETDSYKLPTTSYELVQKYAGITRFKQQFGGESVHLLGSWDLITRPMIYAGFKTLEERRRS